MTRTASRIYWYLRALGRLSDAALERLMPDVPPSTVRASRLNLVRCGVVCVAGRSQDGTRWLWRVV